MATNLRQIRTQLGNPANFQDAVASLGIDTSNFTRNLTTAEEAKIRSYFAGGEQQVAQEIPVGGTGEAPVMESIRQDVDDLSTTMAATFAVSFKSSVLGKFATMINHHSQGDLQALVQQRTGQSVENLNLSTSFNEVVNNPFLSSLNESIKGFSLGAGQMSNPLAFLPQAADLSLPSLPESPENSAPSGVSSEPATTESSL